MPIVFSIQRVFFTLRQGISRLIQKVYFESASRTFQNGSEAVKTPRCGEALYITVCASSELGGFAAAIPHNLGAFQDGLEAVKLAEARRCAIQKGMRIVGIWRFCRLSTALGRPCIKRFGTPSRRDYIFSFALGLKAGSQVPLVIPCSTAHRTAL